jgi:hypothetical protein
MLPIGQVGSLLASAQLNEEVCQQGNQLPDEKAKDCHYETGTIALHQKGLFELASLLKSTRILHKEEIPSSPSSDILMPPPKILPA